MIPSANTVPPACWVRLRRVGYATTRETTDLAKDYLQTLVGRVLVVLFDGCDLLLDLESGSLVGFLSTFVADQSRAGLGAATEYCYIKSDEYNKRDEQEHVVTHSAQICLHNTSCSMDRPRAAAQAQ